MVTRMYQTKDREPAKLIFKYPVYFIRPKHADSYMNFFSETGDAHISFVLCNVSGMQQALRQNYMPVILSS